jgi:hypothetical protein
MRIGSTAFGIGRHLSALRAGGATILDGMIILPRGASDAMRHDAECVCARDPKYDWKHEEDAR